jgi:hypothetical protein
MPKFCTLNFNHFSMARMRILVVGLLVFLLSCSVTHRITQPRSDIKSIKFLSEYDIPYDLRFANTVVGGLSGIDYDKRNDRYFFICDDRSDKNPARLYEGKVSIKANKIDTVYFSNVVFMRQSNGNMYPNNKQDPYHTPDPEAARYDPINKRIVWSSEGERIIRQGTTVLADPTVDVVSMDGHFLDSLTLPANLKMQTVERGPRQNGVLEGMSFADNYKTLLINVEEPLYEDGPRADVADNPYYIRIMKFDAKTKANTAQYAYPLSPVAYASNPPSGFKINGVPDILSIGNDKVLVVERSFSTGRLACTIRVYIADLNGATDISNFSLAGNNNFAPANKKLLINMDELGIYIDNVEGVTFGPTLPNGHKTLLFVADNNFSPAEKAQLLLFEVFE